MDLGGAVAQPIKGGVRKIVAIEPDKFVTIAEDLGPLAIEDFAIEFTALVRDQLQPTDLAGRLANQVQVQVPGSSFQKHNIHQGLRGFHPLVHAARHRHYQQCQFLVDSSLVPC